MSSSDRRIPIVAADNKGTPRLESLNDVIRQLATSIMLLEGRMGPVEIIDGIDAEGALTSLLPGTGQWYQSATIASTGTYIWSVETIPNPDLYQITGTGDGIIVKNAGDYLLGGHVTASDTTGGTTFTVTVDGTTKGQWDFTNGGGLSTSQVATLNIILRLTAGAIVAVKLTAGDNRIGDTSGISSKISLYRLN
jgi:hypothetical protein